MHRMCPPDFMDPNPAAATAEPTINPEAFVLCPVMLPACPMQQCLYQNLYQMAFQQAVQHCAPPRLPRFSWN